MKISVKLFIFLGLLTSATNIASAQSRHNARTGDIEGTVLTVTATRSDGKTDPIRLENLFLYENGVEQRIRNLSFDPSPSRIVLLVDNSQTLPTDLEKLKSAAMEFAYEIFDGDQLFVIAYDEKPEIIQEWTDSADKMKQSFTTFRKKGNPHLFDAINSALKEILIPLMPGTRKTAIVVIGDGLDRGSTSTFDQVLAELQFYNVSVYSLQLPDRTGGAYRRNMPKPGAVISQLTEGTGGLAFPFEESQQAAKMICDELRSNRYLLSYSPLNTSTYNAKRVFLMADEGISVRTKAFQPPNIK
ncbi:MAG: VWA domain-containing protein [Acidobacteria bacterium]|nr:VWA domain-containing protein [Acidobacteriota bacterium]